MACVQGFLDSSLRCASFRMTGDEGAAFGMLRGEGTSFRMTGDEGAFVQNDRMDLLFKSETLRVSNVSRT